MYIYDINNEKAPNNFFGLKGHLYWTTLRRLFQKQCSDIVYFFCYIDYFTTLVPIFAWTWMLPTTRFKSFSTTTPSEVCVENFWSRESPLQQPVSIIFHISVMPHIPEISCRQSSAVHLHHPFAFNLTNLAVVVDVTASPGNLMSALNLRYYAQTFCSCFCSFCASSPSQDKGGSVALRYRSRQNVKSL